MLQKAKQLTSWSSPSSSSDESHCSSDTASATSSLATSNRSHHYSSFSMDQRRSSKHAKCRSACTSHMEKSVPKLQDAKYDSHHIKRKRQHRKDWKLSQTTSSSRSSSEDDTTFCKSSHHSYGRLPASHSLPTIPNKQLKQIRHGEYVDFNVLVARAGSPLTPNTKSNPGLRISSLPKWFHAWNQFLLANVVYHPDVVTTLLIYQARICQYAEHQDLNSVVCYDAAVHTRIANNTDMHWDDQFPDEFNSFLGGRNMEQLLHPDVVCNQPGHFAASCSLRSSYPDRFHVFSPNSQLPQEVSGAQFNAAHPLWYHCQFSSPNRFHALPPNSQLPQEVSEAQSNAAQPPLVPLPIVVPKCKDHNSVASTTNTVNAQLAVTQQPISVIGRAVEDLTQGEPALHSLSLTSFQDTNTS